MHRAQYRLADPECTSAPLEREARRLTDQRRVLWGEMMKEGISRIGHVQTTESTKGQRWKSLD